MDIDLNEDNYNFIKLLKLFSLSTDFSETDLKNAKKKVLKLHPDNCNLDVKYYYFFGKMYKKLIEIHNYTRHEKNEDNLKQNIEINNTFKRYLEVNNITSLENKKKYLKEFNKIKKCSLLADRLKIEVHAGHGLDYKCTKILSKIKEIQEFNIGHFIIGESVFHGLSKVIKNLKKIIK